MKKILTVLLVSILVCTLLAACGSSDVTSGDVATAAPTTAPTAAPAATAQAGNSDNTDNGSDNAGTAAEYEDAMGTFIPAFEEYVGHLMNLVDQSESIATDEEFVAWAVEFVDIKKNIGEAADSLAEITPNVPEEYVESHVKITVAVAAVYDAMTGFEAAVDAVINGDAAAFEDGLVEFVGNMVAADQLWNESVE